MTHIPKGSTIYGSIILEIKTFLCMVNMTTTMHWIQISDRNTQGDPHCHEYGDNTRISTVNIYNSGIETIGAVPAGKSLLSNHGCQHRSHYDWTMAYYSRHKRIALVAIDGATVMVPYLFGWSHSSSIEDQATVDETYHQCPIIKWAA